ncbi:hypothetical protein E4U55_005501 [Claviceps digitariae]|nr:hypothetical protein E4U55_005501 [Claviceps digitariae]
MQNASTIVSTTNPCLRAKPPCQRPNAAMLCDTPVAGILSRLRWQWFQHVGSRVCGRTLDRLHLLAQLVGTWLVAFTHSVGSDERLLDVDGLCTQHSAVGTVAPYSVSAAASTGNNRGSVAPRLRTVINVRLPAPSVAVLCSNGSNGSNFWSGRLVPVASLPPSPSPSL